MSLIHLVYLIPVLASSFQATLGLTTQFQELGNASFNFKNNPCPNAEDIAPCICNYLEDWDSMDMDCDDLADDQELYDVFHAYFPFTNFRTLHLKTDHLDTLSDEVFGDVTFENVWAITKYGVGTLTSVSPKTFMKSASTLKLLYMYYNNVTDFPFETLINYTQLTDFSLLGNPIHDFPIIQSETLSYLNLGKAVYATIPAGALDSLPNLEEFRVSGTKISSMATGLFSPHSKLTKIGMTDNVLTQLETLQFEVISDAIVYIDLSENQIANVDADTFKGVQSGAIHLKDNQLTKLPETTWRPLMDARIHLYLQDNDLTCGCDVAWLVMEPTNHDLVKEAQCHTGDMLVDLDPSDYENC
ncbi:unnamed protein product [Meganyctiphanes norvegica]|uniref:Oplophorus-luciferin 2-monooxygenase non-catalytic subunit n=1 Tax=Meganyctiphanes norvegica TaxID=48144 RepID=A0AAV2PVC1_MEGNR